ncbi:DUF3224 domain-containing protein [Mucilaginibacter ginkgonis]|uniref:DUF3224 domain-containing protein n=1 Tax=Mucilaginibacter ginkgonis TaxID=2682091 RepID=A0A6I4INP2_9SPHI|nr:DUF3224 domain-containing protein [Mucilaginibacter ginkgonis]QQL48942.1 DUF3224 domain-containing protein [Mucilaginibacter ginkgonis]
MQAKGTFEVKILPVEGTPIETEAGIGRMTIDKTWRGDLSGTSKGVMITSMTESTGAMAYVALEKFNGELNGKSGTFYFSHSATMIKGDASSGALNITVVRSSATGELAGLSGKLDINVDGGGHSYNLDYQL